MLVDVGLFVFILSPHCSPRSPRVWLCAELPAEINLDLDDVAVAEQSQSPCSETARHLQCDLEANKDPVAIAHEINEIEIIDPFTVWPATRKISCAVNSVIQRAGEVEICCDQFLNRPAIPFCDIGFVSGARDCHNIIRSDDFLPSSFSLLIPLLRLSFCSLFGLDGFVVPDPPIVRRGLGIAPPASPPTFPGARAQ